MNTADRAERLAAEVFRDAAALIAPLPLSSDERMDAGKLVAGAGCCRIYGYFIESDIPEEEERAFIDAVHERGPEELEKALLEMDMDVPGKDTFASMFRTVAMASADADMAGRNAVFASMYETFSEALTCEGSPRKILDAIFDTYREDTEKIMGEMARTDI